MKKRIYSGPLKRSVDKHSISINSYPNSPRLKEHESKEYVANSYFLDEVLFNQTANAGM